jgi:hypothetical protein
MAKRGKGKHVHHTRSTIVAIDIKDMGAAGVWPSTSAQVEIRRKSGFVWKPIITLLPTKVAGAEFWHYPVGLPDGYTYKLTATDLSATPHVCEEKIVPIPSGTAGILVQFLNLTLCTACA